MPRAHLILRRKGLSYNMIAECFDRSTSVVHNSLQRLLKTHYEHRLTGYWKVRRSLIHDSRKMPYATHMRIAALKTEMFWEVGDADRDGEVDGIDHYIVSAAMGYEYPEADYNVDADFDQDLFVGAADFAISQFYLGWKKELP